MRRPQRFPAAIAACTAAMTAAYLSVGALGYWSQACSSSAVADCELRISVPGVCCMYAVQFLATSANLVLTAEVLGATLCLSFLKLCKCDLQGDKVAQIVLFSIDHDAWARVAACLLLLQVLYNQAEACYML